MTERPTTTELHTLFRPVFERIREGAIDREQQRTLPFEQVAWLKEVRFGALRVPVSHGGYGASVRQYLELLIELAHADPNVAHLLRGHLAVVEEKLVSPDSETRDIWLRRFGAGDIVGNAATEPGSTPLGSKQTQLAEKSGELVLNGTKFYSTGSIFADWIDASASREDGEQVAVLVRTDQPGVERRDDWDGFGQRLTGTGTTVFTDAVVEPHAVVTAADRLPYLGGVYQVILLAVVAGIGRSLNAEAGAAVKARTRVFSHGNSGLVKDDPQIQQVVGEVSSATYAAQALVLATADGFERAAQALASRDADAALAAAHSINLDVYRTQVIVADLVLGASTHLFDALSSSAVRVGPGFDRHWRNARTVLSHNPIVYRSRIIGDYEISGTLPALGGAVGVAAPQRYRA